MPNLVPPQAGGGQPVQPVHHVRHRAGRRAACSPCSRWSAGRSAHLALLHHQSGEPGAVLQRGHLRGVRADHLRLREIPKRQLSARISAPVGGQDDLEGWRFIGQTRWCAGSSSGWSARSRPRAWSSAWASRTSRHAARWQRGLGRRVRRDLRRPGRRHVPRPAHPAGFSRRRLFGLSIAFAAIPLALIALIPNLVVVAVLVVLLGACAGVAYVTGYTIVGLEVDDDTRGRMFAFLQSAIRVILFA